LRLLGKPEPRVATGEPFRAVEPPEASRRSLSSLLELPALARDRKEGRGSAAIEDRTEPDENHAAATVLRVAAEEGARPPEVGWRRQKARCLRRSRLRPFSSAERGRLEH